jgi:phosphonate transport system ATP-binding protein
VPGAELQLQGVSVSFGTRTVLTDLSLSMAPGECVALVGPSGSGKTTLLRLLNGAQTPAAGEVRLDGRALRELGPSELRGVRARIGFIHQDLCLVPNLRVAQNVMHGRLGRIGLLRSLLQAAFPPRVELEKIRALLDRVGIGDRLQERTDRLSGGQRQRVAIARALHQEPRLLLADEPVSSLDPLRSRQTIQLLIELARERGITLVVSLHDLPLAREYFPRLVGLREGRVLFDAPPERLSEAQWIELYRMEAGDGDQGA